MTLWRWLLFALIFVILVLGGGWLLGSALHD